MNCKACGRESIGPVGPVKSPILVISRGPAKHEFQAGIPWAGPGGDAFKFELARAGLHYGTLRVTNMWLHWVPNPKDDIYPHCLAWNREQVYKELKGRKAVLLAGAEAVREFVPGYSVDDVAGLDITKLTKGLPKGIIAYAMYNPAIMLRGGLGETRLAIERFAAVVRSLK